MTAGDDFRADGTEASLTDPTVMIGTTPSDAALTDCAAGTNDDNAGDIMILDGPIQIDTFWNSFMQTSVDGDINAHKCDERLIFTGTVEPGMFIIV